MILAVCVIVRATTSTSSQFITASASASASSIPSSVDNIIPIVIGTTVTIMILLITAILLLLVFIVLVCCKRNKTVIYHHISVYKYNLILQDSPTNQSVPLEICPAYDNIAKINTETCEAYNIARDTHTEQQYETVY